jgi:Protein of unknown function (DUF4231)
MEHEPADRAKLDAAVAARYPEYAQLVTQLLEAHRDRCRVLAHRHRQWFRITGVLTIVFSVSLPALTATDFSVRNVAISVLAVGVAGLSGLRAFYQWDQSWQLYRSQELALAALLTRWQLGMVLIVKSTAADADDQAHALTLDVLNEAYEAGRTELSDFFSGIAWPQKAS